MFDRYNYYYGERKIEELFDKIVPKRHQCHLQNIGMVCVRPDGYFQNKAYKILQYLRKMKLQPIDIRTIIFSHEKFEELYRDKIQLFSPNTWIHDTIYSGNPCIILLFHKDGQEIKNLSAHLNRVKGESSPTKNEAMNGIREEFNRLSSFHGLIHCPEDEFALFREMLIFYAHDEIRNIFLWLEKIKDKKLYEPFIRVYMSYDHKQMYGYCVFEYLIYCIERILSFLYIKSILHLKRKKVNKNIIKLLKRLFEVYKDSLSKITTIRSFKQKAVFFHKINESNINAIKKLITLFQMEHQNDYSELDTLNYDWMKNIYNEFYFSIFPYSLYILSGSEGIGLFNTDILFDILRKNDFYINTWERGIILSALKADINRDNIWEGKRVFPPE